MQANDHPSGGSQQDENSPSFNNPNDDFFNKGGDEHRNSTSTQDGNDIPRPKRIACVVCRKRKLKCDGTRPSCGTCTRLSHVCSYDEVRRKSGPKRGYVKALEARLAQVETLLKTQEPGTGAGAATTAPERSAGYQSSANFPMPSMTNSLGGMDTFEICGMDDPTAHRGMFPQTNGVPVPDVAANTLPDIPMTWDMMQMGLEEALPEQHIIDELEQIFFEKCGQSFDIIHRTRYYANMSLPPNQRPPIALRYTIWTLAASVSEKYCSLQTLFYRRARKYAEETELRGHGENIIIVPMAQTWALLSTYEFKQMYFPRAWLSTGRSVRMCQMMGLHRLDGIGLDVKQCLPPPKDSIEKEERRRTFWMTFCTDRYASIGTGWPMIIDERDILTNLPASHQAFQSGRIPKTLTLKEAMTMEGASTLSPFAGVVMMASLFGRNLLHLHRPDPDDRDDDLNGEFWRRHRHMDHILLTTALSLPSHFRLPNGISDPNIIFTNMNIHASTICLHQAAIFKADKNRLPASVSAESKIRCITAATEIASIMRTISHVDMTLMNPFISFCLYVAARVFVQYLKSRPRDEPVRASLQFLLSVMSLMKKMNPLVESFLVQLDVDLTGTLDAPAETSRFPYGLKKGASEIYVDPLEMAPKESAPRAGPRSVSSPSKANEETPNISSTPFLYCERTVMSLSHEKLQRMQENQNAQNAAAAAAAAAAASSSSTYSPPTTASPSTMDIPGSGNPSAHTTPSNHASNFNSPPPDTSNPVIMDTSGGSNGGGGNFVQTGFEQMGGTGMTPKDMNWLDLDPMNTEQADAMFNDILAMSSPSQWLNNPGSVS